jgi:Cu/Ag efflux protein CusF
MNIKYVAAFAAASMFVASVASAAVFQPATHGGGTVMGVDAQAKTVTIGRNTYVVLGQMPDVRVGEQATIAAMNTNGTPAAWVTPTE